MITMTFIAPDGSRRDIQVADRVSAMKAATDAGVEGIVGDCGGNLSCATCHGYIDADWRARLPDPSEMETAMLDCALDVTEDSRLTCQILASPELDGIVIRIPESSL